MQVPTVGSKVVVRTRYSQGPNMIPPQPDYHEYEGEVINSYKWLTDRQFCLSGDNEWPIRVINMDAVTDVQLVSGSFIKVNTDNKVYTVDGSKGKKYTVTSNRSGWNCTCPGFQFRRQCKHISELEIKNEMSKV